LNNSHPKPFAWVKSADDILASIERFCLRISNSGHYRGLKKNTLQLKTLFALSNLWMVRHQLLAAQG
jgi:IS5 family transposase